MEDHSWTDSSLKGLGRGWDFPSIASADSLTRDYSTLSLTYPPLSPSLDSSGIIILTRSVSSPENPEPRDPEPQDFPRKPETTIANPIPTPNPDPESRPKTRDSEMIEVFRRGLQSAPLMKVPVFPFSFFTPSLPPLLLFHPGEPFPPSLLIDFPDYQVFL